MTDDRYDDSFEAFFREAYRPALRLARHILGDITDAEDAAAEALARALKSWTRVGRLPYRTAWVLRVVTNVALDAKRSRRRGLEWPVAAGPSGEDAVVLRHTLVNELRALPRRQRDIVVMRYLGGLSENEVGTCLGLSVNTVKTHRVRALARLRKRLGPDWSEEVHLVAP